MSTSMKKRTNQSRLATARQNRSGPNTFAWQRTYLSALDNTVIIDTTTCADIDLMSSLHRNCIQSPVSAHLSSSTMHVDSFDFDFEKTEAALNYLSDSLEWLVALAADNLGRSLPLRRFFKLSPQVQRLLKQLESLLPCVHTVYNQLTPVNTLPPEILGLAFEHSMDSHHLTDSDFPSHPWPAIHSVCRYWRNTAARTPKLWNYIHIGSSQLQAYNIGYKEDDHPSNIVLMSLNRSGSLPLTVIVIGFCHWEAEAALCYAALVKDLKPHTSRIRRLHVRYGLGLDILVLFSSEGGVCSLESLYIEGLSCRALKRNGITLFHDWQVPHLHTLRLGRCFGWCGAPFRNLRYLLTDEIIFEDFEDIQHLHTVLSQNPLLEDLVIDNFWSPYELIPLLDTLPVIKMPSLKRILISDCDSCVINKLIESKLILRPGYAKLHSELTPSDLDILFPTPEQCFFPVKRLFVGGYCVGKEAVVGTDGDNSFLVTMSPVQSIPFLACNSFQAQCSQLSELWLKTRSFTLSGVSGACRTEGLAEIKTLVLLGDFERCLGIISVNFLFPSLTVLNLLIDSDELYSIAEVVNFLRARRNGGSPIIELHVVLNTMSNGAAVLFNSWRRRAAKFRKVVPNTSFEDASENPRQMDLPRICTEASPGHSLWRPWDYIYSPSEGYAKSSDSGDDLSNNSDEGNEVEDDEARMIESLLPE
ncbi:hypothetical protein BDY19DRAFT_903159 [Irpex rosettiformis]|uniref:Uncharacterized protein n=1 Tax=Irpex rosettiformis TaxID=378272 RepID=A0ACB8UGK3_9APHY|nr:hypothetical protein BDY19DRAFT_903159 [Irpex rosettiformis]